MEPDKSRLWMTAGVFKLLEARERSAHDISSKLEFVKYTYNQSSLKIEYMPDIVLVQKRAEKWTARYAKAVGIYVGQFPLGTGMPKRAAHMNHEILEIALSRESNLLYELINSHRKEYTPTQQEHRRKVEARYKEADRQLDQLVSIYLGDE